METLYNGIVLPDAWPPADLPPTGYSPILPPYLAERPRIISIDVGRQLLVDDFLIEECSLTRTFHLATKYEGNPVLLPETPLEKEGALPVACPKSGGVWWDPREGIYKMWYEAGWVSRMAYATSVDGVHWERPSLDLEPGTNRILPNITPDSNSVVLDLESADPAQRYKMLLRSPGGTMPGRCMVSADGIHWSDPVATGPMQDRSTAFYNPFRERWVYSIRSSSRGRTRHYHEHADFLEGAHWEADQPVFWTGADNLDTPEPGIGNDAQLYNLDAVAYESLILGLFEIHLGPENQVCEDAATPKLTELKVAFSRDGFYWHRPDRRAFIPAARVPDAWDRGYVQSVGGVCVVTPEELWFYYIGFQGDETQSGIVDPDPTSHSLARQRGVDMAKNGMYARGSTGLARLRRDGFASMDAGQQTGQLTTTLLLFSGAHLFVNLNAPHGELTVEVLDEHGEVIPGFERARCNPVRADSCKIRVGWHNDTNLGSLSGQPVKMRFYLREGSLYSFWVSPDERGQSNGYVAAGGPAYPGHRDI